MIIAGKYEILGKLGQGGQGAVYKARHLEFDEICALKVQPDTGADAGEMVARFRREGRALRRLRHKHIVQVYDLGKDGDQYYLAMEFVDGLNLAQYFKTQGRPSLLDGLEIARQIASALRYAHTQPYVDSSGREHLGMVHRDIKPSNILLRDQTPPFALLADFGLVKLGDPGERTTTGTMLGTYKYSAPEQLGLKRGRERVPVDVRADIFAFGLVLYEMLEGRQFHAGLEPQEILARLLFEPEALEPEFTAQVPPALRGLVRRMMERYPEDRPERMDIVLDTITEAIRDLSDDATTIVPSRPAPVQRPASDEDIDAEIQRLQEERDRRRVIAAQSATEAARVRARDAGAPELATAEFEAAARRSEEASLALGSGRLNEARELYEATARLFETATTRAAEVAALRAAGAARDAMTAARAAAEAAGAPEIVAREFEAAVVRDAAAVAALDAGDAAAARAGFEALRRTYRDLQEQSEAEVARRRTRAAQASRGAAAAADAAASAGAPELAPNEWAALSSTLQRAHDLAERAQFLDAAAAFDEAAALADDVRAAAENEGRRRAAERERQRTAVAEARERVRAAQSAAASLDAAVLAERRFAAASTQAARADEAERAGGLEEAQRLYAEAARGFDEARVEAGAEAERRAAEAVREQRRGAVAAARTTAMERRGEAERADASTLAADRLASGDRRVAEADAAAASDRFDDALALLDAAATDFADARRSSIEAALARRADAMRDELESVRATLATDGRRWAAAAHAAAEALWERAEGVRADGNSREAIALLEQAAAAFEHVGGEARRARELDEARQRAEEETRRRQQGAANEERRGAEQAREGAIDADAPTLASAALTAADGLVARATAAFESGAFGEAVALYGDARRAFDDTAARARDEAARRAADTARSAAATTRAGAEDAGASQWAVATLTPAERAWNDAEAALRARDWEAARRGFERAAAGFEAARDEAVTARARAEQRRAEQERVRSEQLAALDEATADADRGRAAAEAAGAPELAAKRFRAAQSLTTTGTEARAAGDLSVAVEHMRSAAVAFAESATEAAAEAERRVAAGRAAEQARLARVAAATTAMERRRDAAAAADAAGLAPDAWTAAERLADAAVAAREANDARAEERFAAATAGFDEAAAAAQDVAKRRAEDERRRLAAERRAEDERRAAEAARRERVAAAAATMARGRDAAVAADAAGLAPDPWAAAERLAGEAAAARDANDERAEERFAAATAAFDDAAVAARAEAKRRADEERRVAAERKAEEARVVAAERERRRRLVDEARERAASARAASRDADARRWAAAALSEAERLWTKAGSMRREDDAERAAATFADAATAFDAVRLQAEQARQAAETARREEAAPSPVADGDATVIGAPEPEPTIIGAAEATIIASPEPTVVVAPAVEATVVAPPVAVVPSRAGWMPYAAGFALVIAGGAYYLLSGPSPDVVERPQAPAVVEKPAAPAPTAPVVAEEPAAPAPVAPPALAFDRLSPAAGARPSVKEGEGLAFSASVVSPDAQPELGFRWLVDGVEAGSGPTFELRPGFANGGATTQVQVVATARTGRVEQSWDVSVANVNRPPEIATGEPRGREVALADGASQRFAIEANDPDAGDRLTYVWTRDGKEVAQGGDASYTLRDAHADTEIGVTVRDADGATSAARTWKVALAAPTPAVNEPPAIVGRSPKDMVSLDEARTQEFSVTAKDPNAGDRLAYSWFVDGRPVGTGKSWVFTAPSEVEAGARRRVEVEVADAAGLTSERVGWDVVVKQARPRLTGAEPRDRRIALQPGETRELRVNASTPTGKPLEYEWAIDGRKQPGGDRLQLPRDLSEGRHTVQVAAVDRRDLRSDHQEWTIEVAAKPVATTTPPPTTPPAAAAGAVTVEEARAWLQRYQNAWSQRDAAALARLGVTTSARAEEIVGKLDYLERTEVANESVSSEGGGVKLSFDRTDVSTSGKKLSHPRRTCTLERVGGAIVARGGCL